MILPLAIVGLALVIIGLLILVGHIVAVAWLGWVLIVLGALFVLGFIGERGHYWR